MISGQGRMKWQGMMLPKHVVELRKWMDGESYTERPELNEGDLQLIQEALRLAHTKKCECLIKTWADGRIIQSQGIVEELDLLKMSILLENPFGPKKIPVANIINVQGVE